MIFRSSIHCQPQNQPNKSRQSGDDKCPAPSIGKSEPWHHYRTNVGVLVAAVMVPRLTLTYGWRWTFIVTGLTGFIWLILWLAMYRRPEEHPRLSAAELKYIRSDPPESEAKVPWRRLLPFKQTWAFAIGKFMTDPIWWIYLFWLPDF